jgi:molybdopterin synthase sulfur carrier subunit
MATVRYFAAARAAAGVSTEDIPAGSLKELVDLLQERHGAGLARVLGACSFLVDGLASREPTTRLTGASTVDILPPFAGG